MAPTIKTPIGNAPIIPVLMILIGGYVAWFGVHYFRADQKWPTDPIKSVLTTGQPTLVSYAEKNDQDAQLSAYVSQYSGAAAGAGAAAAAGANSIATDAQQYVGTGYVWGGNASKVGDWDCSSFVSYVLGHDLGMALPGGRWGDPGFPPNAHGPTTGSYALYGTPINAADVQAGDLVVWSSHMGIATDGQHVVSARDEKEGVGVDTIAGTTSSLGETVRYRRVTT